MCESGGGGESAGGGGEVAVWSGKVVCVVVCVCEVFVQFCCGRLRTFRRGDLDHTGFWRVRKIQEILGLGATLWRRELSF